MYDDEYGVSARPGSCCAGCQAPLSYPFVYTPPAIFTTLVAGR